GWKILHLQRRTHPLLPLCYRRAEVRRTKVNCYSRSMPGQMSDKSQTVNAFKSARPSSRRTKFPLRTKKCGTEVIQESKNSACISRSRKRAERTIKPSLPGTSTASSAQESSRRDAVVRATDAETALRKLRLEIILFSHEPLKS